MDARQHIIAEAIKEQRQIFGAENPDSQWILSSWDTWERNPYYTGPEQRHPEEDEPPTDEEIVAMEARDRETAEWARDQRLAMAHARDNGQPLPSYGEIIDRGLFDVFPSERKYLAGAF